MPEQIIELATYSVLMNDVEYEGRRDSVEAYLGIRDQFLDNPMEALGIVMLDAVEDKAKNDPRLEVAAVAYLPGFVAAEWGTRKTRPKRLSVSAVHDQMLELGIIRVDFYVGGTHSVDNVPDLEDEGWDAMAHRHPHEVPDSSYRDKMLEPTNANYSRDDMAKARARFGRSHEYYGAYSFLSSWTAGGKGKDSWEQRQYLMRTDTKGAFGAVAFLTAQSEVGYGSRILAFPQKPVGTDKPR